MYPSGGAGAPKDTLDYRDLDGAYFFEPTTEISVVRGLWDGWFSAVLVPTSEHEHYRWHIFAWSTKSKNVELTSLRASEDGLFEVADELLFERKTAQDPTLVPRLVPGILKRSFELGGAAVINGLSATKFDLQRETAGEDRQLLRTATRLMLTVPTDKGVAAICLGIASDGTLSQISGSADTSVGYRLPAAVPERRHPGREIRERRARGRGGAGDLYRRN